MRPLADWDGQAVRYFGHLNTWESLPTGGIRCLFRNVSVKIWGSDEVRHVDHLWFYFDSTESLCSKKIERLEVYSGIGVVHPYQRSRDRGMDYGIENVIGLDILTALNQAKRRMADSPPTALAMLREALQAIENQQALFHFEISVAEMHQIRQFIEDRVEFLDRLVETNLRYAIDGMAQHFSRGKITADPVQFKGAKRPIVKGFVK